MNATKHKWVLITVMVLITILAIVGCQPAAMEQIAPTEIVAATESVIAERETVCPILSFEEGPSITVNDPELGDTDRAFYIKAKYDCSEPYIKGRIFGIQDGYFLKNGDYYFNGMYEFVTDEGGIWKGTCENYADTGKCMTLTGEGRYKGLQMSSEYTYSTSTVKIRVIQLAE
jgi:hypothetical protein